MRTASSSGAGPTADCRQSAWLPRKSAGRRPSAARGRIPRPQASIAARRLAKGAPGRASTTPTSRGGRRVRARPHRGPSDGAKWSVATCPAVRRSRRRTPRPSERRRASREPRSRTGSASAVNPAPSRWRRPPPGARRAPRGSTRRPRHRPLGHRDARRTTDVAGHTERALLRSPVSARRVVEGRLLGDESPGWLRNEGGGALLSRTPEALRAGRNPTRSSPPPRWRPARPSP